MWLDIEKSFASSSKEYLEECIANPNCMFRRKRDCFYPLREVVTNSQDALISWLRLHKWSNKINATVMSLEQGVVLGQYECVCDLHAGRCHIGYLQLINANTMLPWLNSVIRNQRLPRPIIHLLDHTRPDKPFTYPAQSSLHSHVSRRRIHTRPQNTLPFFRLDWPDHNFRDSTCTQLGFDGIVMIIQGYHNGSNYFD